MLHRIRMLPTAKSVIVFFIPFKQELIRESKSGDRPCLQWGVAYVQTNDLIGRLGQAISDVLDYFSDLPNTTDVCGKCAAMMPHSFLNPISSLYQEVFLP